MEFPVQAGAYFAVDAGPDIDAGKSRLRLSPAQRARFEAHYREHRDDVLRVLRARVNDDDVVADLMQEAYLRVMRYRYCDAKTLKFLLLRITLNLAASHHRLARNRLDVPLDDFDPPADEPAIEAQLIREDQLLRIHAAVRSLPANCRQVFVLSRYHGLRHREIAARYEISTRKVEQHLVRAATLIRRQVDRLP